MKTTRGRTVLGIRPRSANSREGFTIIEALVLLVILGVALGAIITTVLWASDLGSFNRATLGMRTVASSLFESLEAIPPATLDSDFDGAFAALIVSLGGSGNQLGGDTVAASAAPPAN